MSTAPLAPGGLADETDQRSRTGSHSAAPVTEKRTQRERKPRGERNWVVVCLEGDTWEDVASELYNAAADIASEHSRPLRRISGSGMVWTGESGRPSCDELGPIVERKRAAATPGSTIAPVVEPSPKLPSESRSTDRTPAVIDITRANE